MAMLLPEAYSVSLSLRRKLSEIKDISKFHKLDKSAVAEMDKVFSHEIPRYIHIYTNLVLMPFLFYLLMIMSLLSMTSG